MRYLIRSFSLAGLAILAAVAAQAAPGSLWVKVSDLKNRPINRIKIGMEGSGPSDLTNDRGLAKIVLPPQNGPGTWVTLKVSGGDYEFVSP